MIGLCENKEKCCGCTACMNICPNNAIEMEADEEGFLYPKINASSCIECGACVKVCPFHPKEYMDPIPRDQEVLAVKHKDDKVRRNSASGGAFTAISEHVLNQGGVVYGAVFNDDFEVVHSKAFDRVQRDRMRGSKYVQSKLGNIFTDIRSTLDDGKLVLFTGTPCQNDGLKNYLGKEYDNLILCDIACHGVPSPKVWETYKQYLEEKYQDRIKKITFRCKDKGWKNSSVKVEFSQKVHQKNMQEDPFYIMFFSHLSIRPSCHKCVYASYHRVTDLTMADFWGIENSNKAFDDNIGVSLLLVNTRKGRAIVENIKSDLWLEKSNQKDCYQPIFGAPSKSSPKRSIFWKDYSEDDSARIIQKYGRLSFLQKIQKKLAVPVLKKIGLYKFVEKIVYKR